MQIFDRDSRAAIVPHRRRVEAGFYSLFPGPQQNSRVLPGKRSRLLKNPTSGPLWLRGSPDLALDGSQRKRSDVVGAGPVVVHSCSGVGIVAAGVAGHPHTAMEDLHDAGGGSHLDLLLCEVVGYAVPVVVELDVIVDVDAVSFPIAI